METQRAIVLVAIVLGSVASVALGSETIAAMLAGGAVGALMPQSAPPPPASPPSRPALPPRNRVRTGRTPVRGVPINP